MFQSSVNIPRMKTLQKLHSEFLWSFYTQSWVYINTFCASLKTDSNWRNTPGKETPRYLDYTYSPIYFQTNKRWKKQTTKTTIKINVSRWQIYFFVTLYGRQRKQYLLVAWYYMHVAYSSELLISNSLFTNSA